MRLTILILLIGAGSAVAQSGGGVDVSAIGVPHLPLGMVTLPSGKAINLNVSAGAGAYRTPTDPPRRIWTISDRGPSVDCMNDQQATGSKVCPQGKRGRVFLLPGYAPSIYAIELGDTSARFAEMVTLKGASGKPLTGLTNPPVGRRDESSFAADGRHLEADPAGIEPGGLVRLADGTFFIAEGYGPSIVEAGPDGAVRRRIVPEGLADGFRPADYPVLATLPARLADRSPGRGFGAIALTRDERHLLVALQSPPATAGETPVVDVTAIERASGGVVGAYRYPLDLPAPAAAGARLIDSRLVEMLVADDDCLLVLERQSDVARIYRVTIASPVAGAPATQPIRNKTLLFSTEQSAMGMGRLTGMAMLSPTELIVTSSELGMDGARTQLFRLTFSRPLTN